jgi:transposase
MAEILCVYRQVAVLREPGQSVASAGEEMDGSLAIISYDEKPSIQAIGTTAPDLPPLPGRSPTVMRDHEYKRHGTLTLMAGIDLLSGHVHAQVKERHRRREFIEFLKLLDAAYPADTAIEIILDNHSAHVSRETTAWLARSHRGALLSLSPRPMVPGSISSRASSPRWHARSSAISGFPPNTNSKSV